MTDARYAIEQESPDGPAFTLYWTDGLNHWCAALPQSSTLLTRSQADGELQRLQLCLPHLAIRLKVVDVVEQRERSAIYGPAFRASIAGKPRTLFTIKKARDAGNEALRAAGYTA